MTQALLIIKQKLDRKIDYWGEFISYNKMRGSLPWFIQFISLTSPCLLSFCLRYFGSWVMPADKISTHHRVDNVVSDSDDDVVSVFEDDDFISNQIR